MDPLEAVLSKGKAAEKWAGHAERVDRRADVVDKSGDRPFGRTHTATNGVGAFEHEHRASPPRQRDRRAEPVRPRTNDDSIIPGHALPTPSTRPVRLSIVRMKAFCQMFPAAFHWRFLSSRRRVRRTFGRWPKRSARFHSISAQNRSSARCPPKDSPSSYSGSEA